MDGAEIIRRFNMAFDVAPLRSIWRSTWHHFGAADLGAELGAMDLGAEISAIGLGIETLTYIFWLLKYISNIVLVNIQIVCSSSDGEDASLRA